MKTGKVIFISLFILASISIISIPSLRWRMHLSVLFLSGKIPDISYEDFVFMLSPNSGQSLTRMIETRDPHAVIHNTKYSDENILIGKHSFVDKCAACHEIDGKGSGRAPALVGRAYKHGESDWAVYRTIRYGVAGTMMPAHMLPSDEVWQISAYIKSLNSGVKENTANLSSLAFPSIKSEDLTATVEPGSEWLTYSGSYSGTRHSKLNAINRNNASTLGVKWIRQFENENGIIQCSPIIRGNFMFVTLPSGNMMALDVADGHVLWEYAGKFASTNRGAAILDDKVFIGTGDARLLALSAQTGAVIWEKSIANKDVYRISAAPLAYQGLIVTGVATFTKGGQGFIAAFDAKNGKEVWRFNTIPGKGMPGNDSWAGDSWKEGGAPTWLTGSYDATNDMLYWGVGNPKPDYNTAIRKGDNLYSNSVVALRGKTGQLLWHFQFTPADDHDWDSNQIPVLLDRKSDKGTEKQILWANRNGFYYVLNRETGKFLLAKQFVKQTWAEKIDAAGRPVPHVPAYSGRKGVLIYPGNGGGTNWWSPTYDPTSDLMIVPTIERGMIYFPSENKNPDGFSSSQSYPSEVGQSFYTSLRAIDASTGKLVWEKRHAARYINNATGGALSTAGGVVFGSDQSTFFALASEDGKDLWSFETGANISAAPITYEVNKQQIVAIMAGKSLITFGLPTSVPANTLKIDTAAR